MFPEALACVKSHFLKVTCNVIAVVINSTLKETGRKQEPQYFHEMPDETGVHSSEPVEME